MINGYDDDIYSHKEQKTEDIEASPNKLVLNFNDHDSLRNPRNSYHSVSRHLETKNDNRSSQYIPQIDHRNDENNYGYVEAKPFNFKQEEKTSQ